jgi:hypothetical protein
MCSPVDPGHYFALTYAYAKARSRRLKAMFQVGVDWTVSPLGYEYDLACHHPLPSKSCASLASTREIVAQSHKPLDLGKISEAMGGVGKPRSVLMSTRLGDQ